MRKAARGRKHKPLKIVAWSVLGVVLIGGGTVVYGYESLNSKLHGSPLHAAGDDSADAPKEIVDSFGRSPINILVMGSDGRITKSDCKYGGATCGTAGGQRADVEMILHVSADRSNATVMSIPRDLYVPLPTCAGGVTNKINSALLYKPGCQVDAVEKLTGIPIDHFIEVDFSGVVAVSNAIGGVPVCVSSNVYDRNSGLKLSKGKHKLKGQAALQFVRTRDAFNDGSDVDRTDTQHAFLSATLNQLEASGTLSNPAKVFSLTSSVFGSLTVDDGIKSVQNLGGLASDIHKVPSKRIMFVTMQTGTDAKGNLVEAARAPALFHAIAQDAPVSTLPATPSASTGASASAPANGATSASPKASAASSASASQDKTNTQALDGTHHQTAATTKACAEASVGNVENVPVGLNMQYTAAGQQAINTPEPRTNHHEMYCGTGPSGTNCYATPDAAYALFPKVKDSAS
ncbi:LCP family protein [Streptomyces mirabilis]